MLFHVSRTCTEKVDESNAESHPIAYFSERAAYVLLGEPGAGKSSLFEAEAENTNDGLCISARDFIALDREEWRDKTLFIDGLDEARAGNDNSRTPLDAIRGMLNKLGCKRFRISCREADWLGSPDADDLARISPNQAITILHLNPLSGDDIKQIISNDQRVPDPNGFIEKAEQFGLSGLLENPQTLDMLIDATKGGHEWPTSKQQVYELACKQLASEFNDDHEVAQTASIPQLMEAAGFLCAVQLIANISGFTEGQAGEGRISLKDLTIPNDLQIHAALKTRLFNKTGSYMHRSVAEYLAAQFIARKINQGLLFNRVLALTTGFDGGIVVALRGLMAWLSVLSPQVRESLIEIDPMGIVVYGDTQLFSTTNKIQLLGALRQEAEKTDYLRQEWQAQSFAAITTKDMAMHLLALLTNPSRKNPEQSVLDCILDGLCNGESIPELKQALITMVRDSSYWEGIRVRALQAFLHQYPNDAESLLELADEICQEKISDNNRLLGLLLYELFPKRIPASKIFQYLKPARNELNISYSYYEEFWSHKFIERLTDENLTIVLDQLAKRSETFLGIIPYRHNLLSMAGTLLVRGLQVHGENTSLEQLYNWLSIGVDKFNDKLKPEYREQISDWLGNHPNIYLGLLRVGISLINNFDNTPVEFYKILARLRHAVPPENFGLWWLEQASASHSHVLSCEFFRQAFLTLINKRGHNGLSLEYFQNWLVTHPEFNETYLSLIVSSIEDWRYEHTESNKNWEEQRKDQLKSRLKYFMQHKLEIAEGTAHPQAYRDLAAAYFKHYHDINGETGEERLSDYFDGNVELINAANSGLRKIINRVDLPELDDIFALAVKNREHYIRLPFLVCMENLYLENPSIIFSLSDNLVSKALAFWYTYGAGEEPAWVKPLSLLNVSLTAQVFIEYISAMLAGKKQHIYGVYQLAHDDDYQEITRLAVIPVLNKYPVRGTIQQVVNLEYLLKAAIKHIPKNEFLPLIEKKLAHKGMDIAQRVYWLVTGLIIEPLTYSASLRKLINGNTIRINHLSSFLCPGWPVKGNNYELPASVMGILTEVLGPRCSPHRETGAHWVGQAENERDYVHYLLNRLGSTPNEESSSVLAHLLMLPQLSAWHTQIQSAQQTQQLSHREAMFKHPNATQVINTLSNSKPANVADLAALTVDCLEQLAVEMHSSNTDSYKQFWNVDTRFGKPETPRPENNCRNYLLERMKPLLSKYDVQVDLEAHQAKDKRADMKVSFTKEGKTFHLPIEIKRDYHKALWRTIHEQLIPLYTIAPETEGRGLFLVIWFNHEKLPTHPQGLLPPKSAEQLATMLKETMTPQEQKLIDVFVLDVSKK
jgi:hypothetical protein